MICLIAGGESGVGRLAGAETGHLDDLGVLLHLIVWDRAVAALVVDPGQKLHLPAALEFKPLEQKARLGQGEKTLFLHIHPGIRNTQPVTEGEQTCTEIQRAEELTRRFRAYFPIPVPEGLAMEIIMTPDASGQLLSACFLTLDSSLLTLQADCVSTGEGVLFALCAGGSMAKALDGSGIPGGWGIYRLSPGGDLETVYSLPNGGRAMAFWSDGDGTLFLLTEEKGAVLLTLLDAATLTPVATQELFPAAEGAPHPQVFPQSDGSFCLLSAGDFLAVLNRRSGAWVVDFTADTSLQSSLGCPLSTPSSRLSLCYDGTRLAITGPCPSTKSEYFLAVYTADGLEYLGGYTSSLYGNHPPDCYPWGSWQDGSCRSIALEPSLPGTETAS